MRDWYPTMTEVRLNKSEVLGTLRSNMADHRAKFEEAMEGYKARTIEILEDHIGRIKANSPERVVVSLPLPEDHTDDYDRVIQMLEKSLDDEVILGSHDFEQYMRDQWGWKEAFAQTHAMYTGQ